MILKNDIETINKYCNWLKEIIYSNKRAIEQARYTGRKGYFVDELNENIEEAQATLDRYTKIKERIQQIVLLASKE